MKLFRQSRLFFKLFCLGSTLLFSSFAQGKEGFFGGEWYFSWGYNKEYWTNSDIHIKQSSLDSDYIVHDVQATDYPQWNEGWLIFDKALFVPQYSLRIGRFIDEKKTWAIEINNDHTKYSSVIGQDAHISGKINGIQVNETRKLTSSEFRYNLHNGANHIMINVVKRIPLWGEVNETLSGAALLRAGIGIMLPHADNTIRGQDVDVGKKQFGNLVGINSSGWWRLNGWTTGVEAGIRFVAYNPIFLELTDKVAFSQMINVPVYIHPTLDYEKKHGYEQGNAEYV